MSLNDFWLITEFDIGVPRCRVFQRSARNANLRTIDWRRKAPGEPVGVGAARLFPLRCAS